MLLERTAFSRGGTECRSSALAGPVASSRLTGQDWDHHGCDRRRHAPNATSQVPYAPTNGANHITEPLATKIATPHGPTPVLDTMVAAIETVTRIAPTDKATPDKATPDKAATMERDETVSIQCRHSSFTRRLKL